MVHRRLVSTAIPELDFDAIRSELSIPGRFDPAVVTAAEAATQTPRLPEMDATDLPLVTIDPPGSRDLDQALAVERSNGGGWTVHYAIADVAAWLTPGAPVDVEARRRTQTYYAPDERMSLHPPVMGEGAASLLPDGPRPAALWSIEVDADGTRVRCELRRALVRSRAQLTYAEVQADIDAGTAPEALAELENLGKALLDDARRRQAIELGLPEQEVVKGTDGRWTVARRADRPVEEWNAQVSLLTGRSAAAMMLDAGIGILRTLPSPDPEAFPRLQRAARNLGISWPDGRHPGEVLASLDTSRPRHAAFADLAAQLLRGAGYTVISGSTTADLGHAGVGDHYAHVTAPLRRLVDRFATEICLSIAGGYEAPEWVVESLASLPDLMADGDGLARQLDRAVVDATEALVLHERVGEVFPASVIETGDKHGTVVLDEPAVRGRCDTRDLPLGAEIHVRCTEADVATRSVRFERVS